MFQGPKGPGAALMLSTLHSGHAWTRMSSLMPANVSTCGLGAAWVRNQASWTWDLYRSILAWGSAGVRSTSRKRPITSRTSSFRHSNPALAAGNAQRLKAA